MTLTLENHCYHLINISKDKMSSATQMSDPVNRTRREINMALGADDRFEIVHAVDGVKWRLKKSGAT